MILSINSEMERAIPFLMGLALRNLILDCGNFPNPASGMVPFIKEKIFIICTVCIQCIFNVTAILSSFSMIIHFERIVGMYQVKSKIPGKFRSLSGNASISPTSFI